MGLATILPKSSIRILVNGRLATGRRTCVSGRGDSQCSRHRVASLWCVAVPVSIAFGVSVPVPVLSAIRLGSVGAGPRTVRVSGLPVSVFRSDLAMLRK